MFQLENGASRKEYVHKCTSCLGSTRINGAEGRTACSKTIIKLWIFRQVESDGVDVEIRAIISEMKLMNKDQIRLSTDKLEEMEGTSFIGADANNRTWDGETSVRQMLEEDMTKYHIRNVNG